MADERKVHELSDSAVKILHRKTDELPTVFSLSECSLPRNADKSKPEITLSLAVSDDNNAPVAKKLKTYQLLRSTFRLQYFLPILYSCLFACSIWYSFNVNSENKSAVAELEAQIRLLQALQESAGSYKRVINTRSVDSVPIEQNLRGNVTNQGTVPTTLLSAHTSINSIE